MAKSKRQSRGIASSKPTNEVSKAKQVISSGETTYAFESTPSTQYKARIYPQWLKLVLIAVLAITMLIPIAEYGSVVWQYALNIPLQDDFDSGLEFIDNYAFRTHTFSERLKLIFSQHNEHRIVLNRLAFITQYKLTGQLNFRELMFLGNAAVLCLFGLLLIISFKQEAGVRRWFLWLPLSFLLFQLVYWELTTWGMASISNFYELVFGWGSLIALFHNSDKRIWFVIALIAAISATFTISNGLMTFIIGATGLLITKQYKRLTIWTVIGVIAAVAYMWGYERPGHHPQILGTLLASPSQFTDYLFTLVGNSFSDNLIVAARAGKWLAAVFIGLFAYTLYQRRLISLLPVWSVVSFLAATCLLISLGRSGFGIWQALSSRYTILSVSLVCFVYILVIELIDNPRLKIVAGLIGLLTSVGLYIQTHDRGMAGILNLTNYLKMNTALYLENPQNLILVWGDPDKAKVIYQNALAKKTYRIPPITLKSLSSQPEPFLGNLQASSDLLFDAKPYLTSDYIVFYQSWALLNGHDSKKSKIEVVAKGPQNSYRFDVLSHLRFDLASQNPLALYSGFSASIPKRLLSPGHYELWISVTNKGIQAYQPLNVAVDV